jgi:hypothetical protein
MRRLLLGGVVGVVCLSLMAGTASARGKGDAGRRTLDDLMAMLEDMGYEPEVKNGDNGAPILLFSCPINGRRFFMGLCPGPNAKKVWLNIYWKLPNGAAIPPAVLQRMLEANLRNGPTNFVYNPRARTIGMALSMDNRDLTVSDLRYWLDGFLTTVAQNESLWNASRWGATAAKRAVRRRTPVEAE